jgi:hypothetical protein
MVVVRCIYFLDYVSTLSVDTQRPMANDKWRTGEKLREAAMAQFGYYFGIRLETLRRTT